MFVRVSLIYLTLIVIKFTYAENKTNSGINSEFKYAKYFKNITAINSTGLPDAARELISQVR